MQKLGFVGKALCGLALACSAGSFAGCAGVKEAWLGVDPDLHKQLFSQRDKNEESPGLDWFGTVKRSDLDSEHINAWWRDAYKLDTLDADSMCIVLRDNDDEKANREKAGADAIADLRKDGWTAGSATTLEAEYPPGTPWPKPTPDAQVKYSTARQTVEEGKWNADHTHQWSGILITWTQICVPAPKVTADTHFLTLARINPNKDSVNMILVWQIVE